MRSGEPSLTARGVALGRMQLDRPSSATGDPDAEARLERSLLDGFDVGDRADLGRRQRRHDFWLFLTARTRFFDDAVLQAIERDVRQIVILAAGYDGRALRFRTPGVRFFEVDHPATQADKRARLEQVGAATDGITFVAADFTEPGLEEKLAAAGHDRTEPSLFTCEGLLRYLPEEWFRALLVSTARCAAPGSALVASISTVPPGTAEVVDDDERARREQLERSGEPVLTVPPTDVALQWVADAGWTVPSPPPDVADSAAGAPRGRILLRAERA